MTNIPGSFVWYELMTTDLEGAMAFYKPVVGWEMQDAPNNDEMPGMRYVMLSMAGKGIGGMMQVPPLAAANGAPPRWYGYVGVDDVDAAAQRLTASGGAIHHGPADIPGVGRFASVADPQGAPFVLFRPFVDMPNEAYQLGTIGHGGWNELHTSDWEAALSFYGEQFGWRKVDALDMGQMGTYLLFAPSAGDAVGGMMNSPNFPRPTWLYYFCVGDIDDAATRVVENGGKVLHGPSAVPGGAWIIQAQDPQGVLFALVGQRNR